MDILATRCPLGPLLGQAMAQGPIIKRSLGLISEIRVQNLTLESVLSPAELGLRVYSRNWRENIKLENTKVWDLTFRGAT